ncbi:YkgJ family cysteine cluster protein [Treponema medium]|uniref:YkgJ family cysteine cluster protein n=2 Tax=Treponema medium TaxID=58231 RepID=A0AA87NT74_TREMD|nr:YkgJ family cysteine cluster protein [Treponema medium]EPF29530.1 hypothetical protein HMPREF9195_00231 [Treponema medium ATCC 700293]QSH96392.1 YkgJ family cysteine cluster protein [Treponema medium]
MIKEAEKFAGTVIYNLLMAVDSLYNDIDADQKIWKAKSPMQCPDGCGSCCVHFEPEVYEAEALYLAAWMMENQTERADRIAEADSDASIGGDGCVLFDPESPYHCTVYDGRCLICRLFGFSGDHGKDGCIRWKPCRYMAPSAVAGNAANGITGTPINGTDMVQDVQTGHQYGQEEMMRLFGTVPPYMGAASSSLLALNPDDTHPRPLRIALPAAIKKLKMLLRFITPPEPDCPSPCPLSA